MKIRDLYPSCETVVSHWVTERHKVLRRVPCQRSESLPVWQLECTLGMSVGGIRRHHALGDRIRQRFEQKDKRHGRQQ